MENVTFDNLFTTGQLQMYKVLLPCLPPNVQGTFAVYIKMRELQYTLQLTGSSQRNDRFSTLKPPPEGDKLFDALLPYCDPEQEQQIREFKQVFDQFGHMKEMMETISLLQEMFPEGIDPQSMDPAKMMELFQGGIS